MHSKRPSYTIVWLRWTLGVRPRGQILKVFYDRVFADQLHRFIHLDLWFLYIYWFIFFNFNLPTPLVTMQLNLYISLWLMCLTPPQRSKLIKIEVKKLQKAAAKKWFMSKINHLTCPSPSSCLLSYNTTWLEGQLCLSLQWKWMILSKRQVFTHH